VAEGVSLEYLYDQSLISPRFGDDRDRISSAQLALLYYNANLSTDDEGRLNSRRRIPIGFGILATRAIFGCPTLESALGAVIHLAKLTASTIQMGLRIDHDEARLIVHCDEGRRESDEASLEDAYLSFMFMCINHFLGHPLPLAAFETRDHTHMNLGSAHWATRAQVRASTVSALLFPKAALLSPQRRGASEDLFRDVFREWIVFVEGGAGQLSAAGPPIGAVRMHHLASIERVSPASLRRRLESTGGYRQTRAAAIVDAGLNLLLGSGDSVDSIALQLGYSEARSFRRFIKAATGKTPAEWRNVGAQSGLLPPHHAVHERIEDFARQMDSALGSVPILGEP
jgi:AraC-like DNA-binding protein